LERGKRIERRRRPLSGTPFFGKKYQVASNKYQGMSSQERGKGYNSGQDSSSNWNDAYPHSEILRYAQNDKTGNRDCRVVPIESGLLAMTNGATLFLLI
jgi:hypothetical protein